MDPTYNSGRYLPVPLQLISHGFKASILEFPFKTSPNLTFLLSTVILQFAFLSTVMDVDAEICNVFSFANSFQP